MSTSFAFLLTSLLILPAAFGILAPLLGSNQGNLLLSGQTLKANDHLQNGNCVFVMQDDCNLVLYNTDSPTWASNTANGNTNCQLLMQSDGNLVIYDGNGNALWHTGTATDTNTYPLVLQSDCSVVMYGAPRWTAKGNN